MGFDRLRRATREFSVKLGEGATGEVFRGDLDGVPVAVKCLKLPPAATEGARAALARRYRVELGVLGTYRHARVVRLLAFAEDDAAGARYPFALVFECLEAGSLGDWLQVSNDACF